MKIFDVSNNSTHRVIEILGIKIKFKIKKSAEKCRVYIEKGNNVLISKALKKDKKFHLDVRGTNNTIIIPDINIGKELHISMYAVNSTLIIGKGTGVNSLNIIMGVDNCNAGLLKNATVTFGERVTVEDVGISVICGNTNLSIGDDCMFSHKILIFNSDNHPIYKKGTKEIVNRSYDLHIGNHCWIGYDVTILKNSILPDNTIVGCGSVVSGKFTEPNCAIAGNPAKVIKRDVDWHMCDKGDYINNEIGV